MCRAPFSRSLVQAANIMHVIHKPNQDPLYILPVLVGIRIQQQLQLLWAQVGERIGVCPGLSALKTQSVC
jgi:hypothetical protein